MAKISIRPLIAILSRLVKVPTGEVGDVTYNVGQIADFIDDVVEVDTSGAEVDLPFEGARKKIFISSDIISGDLIVNYLDAANAWHYKWLVNFDDLHTLTFVDSVSDAIPRWNSSAKTFTPDQPGKYTITADYDGEDWILTFSLSPAI
jgi:hypothetical protein